MSAQSHRRRGEPLLVLGLVLIGWTMMRSVLWESPFPVPAALAEEFVERFAAAEILQPIMSARGAKAKVQIPSTTFVAPTSLKKVLPLSLLQPKILAAPSSTRLAPRADLTASRRQMLGMATTTALPVAPETTVAYGAWPAPRIPFRPKAGRARWSADGWVLYRPGSRSGFAATQRPASYGASQAGAALRYRLNPNSSQRPEAYLRVTTALSQIEHEAALGLSARPFGGVPLRVAGEIRYSKLQAGNELRPAVFAHSELPPVYLPAELRGDAYAQAGYITGDYETGFVDGQAALTRQVARFDLGTVRVGAGTWGGAQEGAVRLDVGPTAKVDIEISDVRARLSLDYRIKVAGDAEPGSGAALTLATGF